PPGVHILDPQVQPHRKAVGDGHEAGCATNLRRKHDVEGLDRHPRQSHEVAFLDWPRIAVAGWVHLVGANLLVLDSFDRGSLQPRCSTSRDFLAYLYAHERRKGEYFLIRLSRRA